MVWPGPQEHRSLSLLFSCSRLVTCDCSLNLSRTWGSFELPPKWKGDFYQGMLIHFVENCCWTAAFSWNVWQDMVSNRRNIETLANLVSKNQSSTSLGQRNTSLTMALDYRSVSVFLWENWLNLMFSGDSWGIWITCLARFAQFIF